MDDAAAFSPDGRRLAFVSTREGNADIFVIPFAPSDITAEERAANLTRRPGGDMNPASRRTGAASRSPAGELWEPRERFAQVRHNYGVQLYVMDADGSNVRRLSEPGPGPEMPGFRLGRASGSPAWSLDGRTLFFYQVGANLRAEIRRVGADGSRDTPVVPDGLSPALRPDGRLAFTRPQLRPGLDEWDTLTRTGDIVSVAADGSDVRPETDTARSYYAPAFDRSGHMVCHGPGPVEGLPVVREGTPFAPPDARREVRLPDRALVVRGIRGHFPALTAAGDVLLFAAAGPSGPAGPAGLRDRWGGAARAVPPSGGRGLGRRRGARGGLDRTGSGAALWRARGQRDIWKLRLHGTGAVNLTAEVPGNDALPHVSADGRPDRVPQRRQWLPGTVQVMDGDGKGRRRLTDAKAIETMPALSPDGEWVVFPTDRAGGRSSGSSALTAPRVASSSPIGCRSPTSPSTRAFARRQVRGVHLRPRRLQRRVAADLVPPALRRAVGAVPVAGGPAVRLTLDKSEDGPSDWGHAPRVP